MTLPNRLKYNQIVYAFLSIFLFTKGFVQAQSLNYTMVEKYDSIIKAANGFNQNLINGYQYINSYPNAKGHAFFYKDEFLQGKININNKEYNKVYLKYDVYGQKVLLKYRTLNGGSNQIELHNHLITQLELKNYGDGNYKTWIDQEYLNTGNRFKIEVILENGKKYISEYDTLLPCPEIDQFITRKKQ